MGSPQWFAKGCDDGDCRVCPVGLTLPEGIHHTLELNPHNVYYETIPDFLSWRGLELTGEDLAKCLATGQLWVLQWYPDNPVSFRIVAGPTLHSVLSKALCDTP